MFFRIFIHNYTKKMNKMYLGTYVGKLSFSCAQK
jgi:hypothetical protein